jgi:DNA invertase Pin-like site-specific DNA recombinase
MSVFGKPRKVALYIRVSTDEQKTDLQLMDLKEYIQSRGYVVYDTYEDVISGTTKERKALDRLVSDARHRKFDIVLVWKFHRFARLFSFNHINSAYAEFERELIQDRVIAGIKAKREKTGTWGRKSLHDETQAKIRELAKEGMSIRKIAARLQLSTRTVQKYKGEGRGGAVATAG